MPVRSMCYAVTLADRHELLFLEGGCKAVAYLVRLGPVLQRLHVADPATHVGVICVRAMHKLTQRHQLCPDVVGNRRFVPAKEFAARPDQIPVGDAKPVLSLLLAPGDGAGVSFVGRTLMVRK